MSVIVPCAPTPPALLEDIDWQTYRRLSRAFQGRRRFRLTYDRGTLEIMSPLWEHETPAYLLGRFIEVLTLELGLPLRGGRSVTLRCRWKRRGLESDNCYWIASAPRMQGKRQLDLRTDPPPDLAVEVAVTNSSIDRMPIYAALKVPEVWRLSAAGLTFHILTGGAYRVQPNSLVFPRLTSADLSGFMNQQGQMDDNSLALLFRDWVRQHLLGGSAAPDS